MDDRKRAVRVASTLEVSFRKVESNLFTGARSKNVSETGLCIPLTYFPDDSLFEIVIHTADSKDAIKAIARVAWVVTRSEGKFPFEAGLELLNLLPLERETLRKLVARSNAKGGESEIRWIG